MNTSKLSNRFVQSSLARATFSALLFFTALTSQAQTKVCMSYDDFKANKWKPYESLTNDKKPDSCRIQYDGMEFSIKTDDKEVNQIIKNDVFLISVDGQLFINSRKLRDDDGAVLPISKYTRALPYKDGKLCVISYKVTLGDVLDLVNLGLDIGLLATGHYTAGSLFLAEGQDSHDTHERQIHGTTAARRSRDLRDLLRTRQQSQPAVGSQHPAHLSEKRPDPRLSSQEIT